MKVRITLVAESVHPVSVLKENPERKIRSAWALLLTLISKQTGFDKAAIENVEILDEGGVYKLVSEEIDSWKGPSQESEGGEE